MTVVVSAYRAGDVAAVAAGDGVAILPIGATEQHGPHLPLTTDATIAEEVTRRAVESLAQRSEAPPVWVLPTLALGRSIEHAGFPGTLTLSAATLAAVCMDIGRSLAAAGVRTLVFANAHGGNPELLQVVSRDIRHETGVFAVPVHVPGLPLPPELLADIEEPAFDVHAGFSETSMMLAIDPASVVMDGARADGIERARDLNSRAESGLVSVFGEVPWPWSTIDVSESGTIGDPRGANASWGEAALSSHATSLAKVILDIAKLRGDQP